MNSSEQREFWSFWCTSIQRRYSKFQEIEELFHTTLEEVTNIKLSGHSWIQASTPVSSGCIGLRKLGDLSCPVYFSSLHQSHDLSNKILAKFNVDIMTNELSDKIRQFPSNSKDKTNFWEFVIFRYYYYATMLGFLHHSIQKHRSGCKLSHPVVLDYYWMTILQGSQSLSDLAAYIARSMKSIHVSSVM